MARTTVVVLILLFIASSGYSQSRTEEARKRLDGERSSTTVTALFTVLELTIDFMPEFFYFRSLHPDEPRLRYNPTPFNPHHHRSNSGIRNFSGYDGLGQSHLIQLRFNTSMPQGTLAMEQLSMEAKGHFGFWAVHSRYEQLQEAAAPYPIRQFNLAGGRKFRFLTDGDAGLLLGVRSLGLGSSRYTGPELMADFSWYVRDPFSIHYTYSSMVQRHGFIRNHEFGTGLHRGQFHFGLSHRWLDILGVQFRTFSFGVGVNF